MKDYIDPDRICSRCQDPIPWDTLYWWDDHLGRICDTCYEAKVKYDVTRALSRRKK